MRLTKRAVALVMAVVVGLSLMLIPVVNRTSPTQAAVNWTKYTGDLTLQAAGQNERYVMDACVIKEDPIYKMWYTHGKKDLTFTDIVNTIKGLSLDNIFSDIASLDPAQFLTDLADLTGDAGEIFDILDGISTVIGYAESTDGTTWTVVNSEVQVLASGSAIWDSVGSPCVILDDAAPASERYKMWYARLKTDVDQTDLANILDGMDGTTPQRKAAIQDLLDGTHTVIGYATSPDGVDWTVAPGEDEVLAGDDDEVWNSVGAPCVIWDTTDSEYKMWYTRGQTDFSESDLDTLLADPGSFAVDELIAVVDGTQSAIGYATSPDGINWTPQPAPVLAAVGKELWNSLADPSVIKSGSSYEMWYTKCDADLIRANAQPMINEIIGVGPGIGTLWTNLKAKSFLDFITDDLIIIDVSPIENILSASRTVIGYATSSDGINWEPEPAPDLVGGGDYPWSSVSAPTVVKSGSNYKMWYIEGMSAFSWGNLIDLVLGSDLPLGYAHYTAFIPPPFFPPPPPPTPEQIEAMTPEEAAAILAGMSADQAAAIIEQVSATAAAAIFELLTTEVAVAIIEQLTADTAAAIIGRMTAETAAAIIEQLATDTAAAIFERLAAVTAAAIIGELEIGTAIAIIEELETDTAAAIVEELETGTAVAILEELGIDTAAAIVEELTAETAADIVTELETETAAAIVEELAADTAAAIVEEIVPFIVGIIMEQVETEKAADIMEKVSTEKLNSLVRAMRESFLMNVLPEMPTVKLRSIDVETLFDKLPNAPTEQLIGEDPPEPPADLTDPIVRYTTPSGAQYVAVRTEEGEWVIVMGTPMPVDGLMIKTSKALTNVVTTLEVSDEQPAAVTVGLPAGQIVYAYLDVNFENATPEDIELGHMTFKVENSWLEQNSIHKWSVTLNWYDSDLDRWVALPTRRIGEDSEYVYYTATITRFSNFAVSGSQTAPRRSIQIDNLAIDPPEAEPGEDITISGDVTNVSGRSGTLVVTLWIDGTVEAGKNVSLAARKTEPVSFTVTRDTEGSYDVRLGRLFGSFSIAEPEEVVPPEPPDFTVSDLRISPTEVESGEEVTVSVLVRNIGELTGSYDVALMINNLVMDTRQITLDGGASQRVTFTTFKNIDGTYTVVVATESGTFEVMALEVVELAKPFNWWLISGIIGGVVVVAVIIWLVVIRRRAFEEI